MSSDFDRDQLLDIFVAEASDDMGRFWRALHPEGKSQPEPGDVADFHAVGHKLKGAALLYGFAGLGQLGALLEETLEHVHEIPPARWPDVLELIRDIVASFRVQVEQIGRGRAEDPSVIDGFVRRCAELMPPASQEISADSNPSLDEPSDEYLLPPLDEEVLSYFSPEAQEYLDTIQTLLHRLDADSQDAETIHHLYRVAHTLKGSAYTVGFQVVGDVAHPIEACMIAVREGNAAIAPHWITLVRQAVQVIRSLMARDTQSLPSLRREVPQITTLLRALEEGTSHPPTSGPGQNQPDDLGTQEVVSAAFSISPSAVEPATVTAANELTEEYLIPALDAEVMSYFAPEAQEYLESLEADLLRVDKDAGNPETIHQLFRTAHTLKGSAYTVGFQAIGDLTHHIEDFMGAVREGNLQLLPGHTDVLLRSIDPCWVVQNNGSQCPCGS
jgi:chemosensory pili system protein ChpA (sensor histidine kinase/response regulator)